jgi:hypothetical protein
MSKYPVKYLDFLMRSPCLAGHGEVGQEGVDLRGAHVLGVAFIVEKDE